MIKAIYTFLLSILVLTFAVGAEARFIQPDWWDPTEPGVGTNRYSYSNNNPINLRDKGGNFYEGRFNVYPSVPYNTTTSNPVLRGLDNTARYIANVPTSALNLFADGVFGVGSALAPHAGTLENLAMTTPYAIDDVGAAAVNGLARMSTALDRGGKFVNPNSLNFSQRTAGGVDGVRADALRNSMSQNGWDGPAIDVVQAADGSLVAIDNTRVAVARELGITKIPVNIRSMSETLPESMAGRFGSARTWGGALRHRTENNNLGGTGTNQAPRMGGERANAGGGFGAWLSNLFGGDK